MTKRTALVVLSIGLLLGAVLVAQGAPIRLTGIDRGYQPAQPIQFSHRLHAGDLTIPCLYCHYGAERSRHAGIPPTSVCMSCHLQVTAAYDTVKAEEAAARREGRQPERITSAEIQKLYDSLGLDGNGQRDPTKRLRAIRWKQVHTVADFVAFDHRRHLAAGVGCARCHGRVQAMEVVSQTADLTMSWCVSCHRTTNAAVVAGAPSAALNDCGVCHY